MESLKNHPSYLRLKCAFINDGLDVIAAERMALETIKSFERKALQADHDEERKYGWSLDD